MVNIKPRQLIEQGEGFRALPYRCPEGALTIGYGYNLDANPLRLTQADIDRFKSRGITKAEALALLTQLIEALELALNQQLPWWASLNQDRQAVLIDMAYNLGLAGLMRFTNTLKLLSQGEFAEAAQAMLSSRWAQQVKYRAYRNANIIKTGKFRV